MKKAAILVLVALLSVITVGACSSTPSPTPAKPPATSAPATTAAPTTKPATTTQAPSTTAAASPKPSTTAASTTPAAAKVRVLMGSTGTASSDYTFAVQWAKIMNQYVPNLDVTVVETASSIENLQRMARGEFALNIYGNPDSTYTALHGIPPFQGTPPTKQRDLFAWSKNICYIMVRTDSGITNLAGLEGKKVATGPPGSATMDYSQRCLAALNIKPDWQPQSFADGSAALKDKRVVGYTKSFATSKVDASVLDILATTKVTLLPFTADQRATVQKTAPWIPWYDVTAGWWKEFPDVPAHITFGFAAATGAHADLISNDMAYAIMAASTEHMSDWTWPAYAGGLIKPLDTMLEMLKNMPEPPWLHAGAVKYYKDKGYTVPANIISPEYKG